MSPRAYYNENDPYCVAWLHDLISKNLIAPGDVDSRDIRDVKPYDLKPYTQHHFFAGIGGWSLALRLAAFPDRRKVWTGSCPCQPFSQAGARRGFADERHLWPFWHHLIQVCRPPIVFGEQVAKAPDWIRLVRSDLEALDYAVGAIPIEAASAGADHLRDRFWFVADADFDFARSQGRIVLPECAGERIAGEDGLADAEGERGREVFGHVYRQTEGGPRAGHITSSGETLDVGFTNSTGRDAGQQAAAGARHRHSVESASGDFEWVLGADGKARRVKPGICLLAHDVPARVAKLRAFGNAIVPQCAAEFIKASCPPEEG